MGKFSLKSQTGDLTQGVIWKQIVLFAIPMLLGNIFQILYNTVDSVVVGNYVGDAALAAVGASSAIINLLVSLFSGLSTGAGIIIARYFGARDRTSLRASVHTSMVLCIILGAIISLIGVISAPPLLRLINTPPDVFPGAVLYLRIIFGGVLPMMIYNMGAGVLRAVGDSKTPLYYLIFTSLLNIVLDLAFVLLFHMGVEGVAIATVIAQGCSALLVLRQLFTTPEDYSMTLKECHITPYVFTDVLKLGLPSGLQNAIISVSNIVVQGHINSFGTTAMAGCAAYDKIDAFCGLLVISFSMAITTFVSQNIGAEKYDRVHKGTLVSLGLCEGVVLCVVIFVNLAGRQLLGLFNSNPEVIQYGYTMLQVLSVGYFFLTVAQMLAGVLRGAGNSFTPMIISVGNMCVLRVVWLSVVMPMYHNILLLFFGYTLTWFTTGLCMFLYYKKANWLLR